MKVFTFLLLIIATSSLAQKFEEGTIVYTSGKTLTGLVRIPDAYEKEIVFKAEKKADKQEIKSEELKSILIKTTGEELKFVRDMVSYGKKKEMIWVQEQVNGFCSLYTAAEGQTYVRSGNFTSAKTNVHFFMKRKGEEAMTRVGTYITGAINVNANNPFRKATAEYFKDAPELVAKINNKQYGLLESHTLVMDYNKMKKDKTK